VRPAFGGASGQGSTGRATTSTPVRGGLVALPRETVTLTSVCDAVDTPHCRTHPSTSAVLRESRAPAAIIVEPGFLTHPDEGRALLEVGYQRRIADALADAMVAFLLGEATTAVVA
jgi:hypothetical protein